MPEKHSDEFAEYVAPPVVSRTTILMLGAFLFALLPSVIADGVMATYAYCAGGVGILGFVGMESRAELHESIAAERSSRNTSEKLLLHVHRQKA